MGNGAFSKRKQLMYVIIFGAIVIGLILKFGAKMIGKADEVADKRAKQQKNINKQYEKLGFDDYNKDDTSKETKKSEGDKSNSFSKEDLEGASIEIK